MACLRKLQRVRSQAELSGERLPPFVLQQEMRLSAAVHRLPAAVEPQLLEKGGVDVCDVCQSAAESSHVRLLCCSHCGLIVHNTCYGTSIPSLGTVWRCEVCSAGTNALQPPVCALCPVSGGTMRFTKCGRWVHTVCALWIPGVTLESGAAPCIDKACPFQPPCFRRCFVAADDARASCPQVHLALSNAAGRSE
jgi:PHD-zinc-finger like domain/PHD-finger